MALEYGRSVSYVVDARGRRIVRKVDGVATHRFLWQSDLRIAAEVDSSGQVLTRYVYGTQINVPDLMIRDGATYRILHDHLGSPRLVVDTTTGDIVRRMDFDEWGNVTLDTNPGFHPFGFAGGLYDPATGLTRFGARDYDATTSRWTTKDPILFRGGLNVFAYVAGDPVNSSDPSGLDFIIVANGFATYFTESTFATLGLLPFSPILSVPARSGSPANRDPTKFGGPTPPGTYELYEFVGGFSPVNHEGFCDGTDCWFAAYRPLFDPPNGRCPDDKNKGRCGMHPDKNKKIGTLGCTGLFGPSQPIRMMKELVRNAEKPLPVMVFDTTWPTP